MSNSENKIIVDNIRSLCKAKNTSITKLEEKLGFGNGSIGKWAKAPKSPPFAKLSLIANELNVPVSFLVDEYSSLDDVLLMTAIENGKPEVVEMLREQEAAKYGIEQKNKPTDNGELMDAESVRIRALISAAPEWKRKAVLAILEAEDNPQ